MSPHRATDGAMWEVLVHVGGGGVKKKNFYLEASMRYESVFTMDYFIFKVHF